MVDIEGGFKTVLIFDENDQIHHVEVEDEEGFAGYDPTEEQIVAAIAGALNRPLHLGDVANMARIADRTRTYHQELVALGEKEIAGFDDGIFSRRNKDVAAAGKQFDLGSSRTWRHILRTTDSFEVANE